MSDVVIVCHTRPNQETDDALFRQLEEALISQALVLIGVVLVPIVCWRDSTTGHKQSRRLLKCIHDNSQNGNDQGGIREMRCMV